MSITSSASVCLSACEKQASWGRGFPSLDPTWRGGQRRMSEFSFLLLNTSWGSRKERPSPRILMLCYLFLHNKSPQGLVAYLAKSILLLKLQIWLGVVRSVCFCPLALVCTGLVGVLWKLLTHRPLQGPSGRIPPCDLSCSPGLPHKMATRLQGGLSRMEENQAEDGSPSLT